MPTINWTNSHNLAGNSCKIFQKSLNDFEGKPYPYLPEGHTIDRHWDRPYSYLNDRCAEDADGTFSTWTDKGRAYDRIKRVFRANEANMVNMAAFANYSRSAIHRQYNPKFSEHGKLVRCSLPGILRYADYLSSGSKRTRISVHGRFGNVQLVSAFPTY